MAKRRRSEPPDPVKMDITFSGSKSKYAKLRVNVLLNSHFDFCTDIDILFIGFKLVSILSVCRQSDLALRDLKFPKLRVVFA